MHRYKIVGYTRQRLLIVWLSASCFDQAKERAYDDFGLRTIASIRRIGPKLKSN